MAKLTADEQKLLEELNARANEPDEDDFEIEIYDTGAGKGARIPHSRGRKWLYDNFGLGDNPEPPAPEQGEDGKAPKGSGGASGGQPAGYFARKPNA